MKKKVSLGYTSDKLRHDMFISKERFVVLKGSLPHTVLMINFEHGRLNSSDADPMSVLYPTDNEIDIPESLWRKIYSLIESGLKKCTH
jgi:hypothetical protein